MDCTPDLNAREQALLFNMMEALTSSLELSEVLPSTYQALSRLLPAEHAALCISKPGLPTEYDWMVAEMPQAFFARYPEMAAKDFVRQAVVNQPNLVLRDSEMVSRKDLTRSPFYAHCRELGMPLEHVMAVMLDVGLDWHGGFMLYRQERRHAFSDRERALLQRLTPVLTGKIRNCRMLSDVAGRGQLLEALFRHQGAESVVLTPSGTEVMRTARATPLLEKWFAPHERGRHGIPRVLAEQLKRLAGYSGLHALEVPDSWQLTHGGQRLKVTFVPLPEEAGRKLWALMLQEVSPGMDMPPTWRKRITPREAEVVACVLRGWDNKLIGEDLGCKEATVKKHLQRAFDKLGVDSRAALISRAAQR
jgi:DNA-binding CsgD family transcriptional regulator